MFAALNLDLQVLVKPNIGFDHADVRAVVTLASDVTLTETASGSGIYDVAK